MVSFGTGVAGIGLIGMGGGEAAGIDNLGAAVIGSAKSYADTGSPLADVSARTGIPASSLSALGYAVGMTGADSTAQRPPSDLAKRPSHLRRMRRRPRLDRGRSGIGGAPTNCDTLLAQKRGSYSARRVPTVAWP